MTTLADELIQQGVAQTPAIIEALRSVHRQDFLPDTQKGDADINLPLPIGRGQTNSQPYTVAFMLEKLQPRAGDTVLDVGFGSGWTTALLATIVGPAGRVVAIERIEELKEFGDENLKKYDLHNVTTVLGDGAEGYPNAAPFARIHVGAAASTVPDALVKQLAPGGRMVIPVGVGVQYIQIIDKNNDGTITEKNHPGFNFVPLVEGPTE